MSKVRDEKKDANGYKCYEYADEYMIIKDGKKITATQTFEVSESVITLKEVVYNGHKEKPNMPFVKTDKEPTDDYRMYEKDGKEYYKAISN